MNNRNLITALAIVALITIAATTAGCATNTSPTPTPIPSQETAIGNNTRFSSAAGFNITYPTTLKKDSSTDASQPVRIYVYLATNNTVDGVNVATTDITANDTLADWVTFNMNKVNNYQDYKLISNNSTSIGNKQAYNAVWQATVPVQLSNNTAIPASVKNSTLKVMQTFVINNNKGYVVTYKALPSDYDKYLAQAQQIISSFKLTSPFNQI